METDSASMTVTGSQKLLDWVGHVTNILVLTEKRCTWTGGSAQKSLKIMEDALLLKFSGVDSEQTNLPTQRLFP